MKKNTSYTTSTDYDIYVNGISQTLKTGTNASVEHSRTIIERQRIIGGYNYTLNELMTFTTALTSPQVLEYYQNTQLRLASGLTESDLYRYYKLAETNTPNNGILFDYSQNGAHATFVTNATQPSNAAVIGIDKGYQTALGQFNRYPLLDGSVNAISNVDIPILRNTSDYIEVGLYTPAGVSSAIFETVSGNSIDTDIGLILANNGVNSFYVNDNTTNRIITNVNGVAASDIIKVRVTRKGDSSYDVALTDRSEISTTSNTGGTIPTDKVFRGFTNNNSGVSLNSRIFYVNINGSIHNPNDPQQGFTISGALSDYVNIYGQNHNSITDIFGNAFQYEWKEGMLNFVGSNNKATTIGAGPDTSGDLTVWMAVNFENHTGDEYLFSNLSGSAGCEFTTDGAPGTKRIRAFNWNGGLTHVSGAKTIPADQWMFVAVTRASDGTTNFYVGDESSEMAISGIPNQVLGTPIAGGGTSGILFANQGAGISKFRGRATDPIIKESILTLTEMNELRQYVLNNIINP